MEELLTTFERRFSAVRGDWERRISAYNDSYRRMLGIDVGGAKPFGAKVNSQHTHAQLLTHSAFVLSGLVPTWPWVYAEADEPFRFIENAATEEFNARLKQLHWYRNLYFAIREADKCGMGVLKLDNVNGRLRLRPIDAVDMAWDPQAQNLRLDAQWVIERYRQLTKANLYALADMKLLKKSAVDAVVSAGAGDATARDERRRIRKDAYSEPSLGDDDEYYTLYDMVEPSRRCTIHRESGTILWEDENPYGFIPYYDFSCFPESFEPEGYGIPELGADLQDEINTCRRQRIDCRSFAANPMIKLARSAGLDPASCVARPGGVYLLDSPASMMVEPIPDTSAPLMQEEALLSQDYDRLVGVQPMTRGETGMQMKATVANIIHGNLNVRFSVTINMLQQYPIAILLQDIVELCADLYEHPCRVTDIEWHIIRDVANRGRMSLVPHTEAYIGNSFEKFQLLANMLGVAGHMLRPEGAAEILKDMLNLLQIRDPERITKWLVTNPTPSPLERQGATEQQETEQQETERQETEQPQKTQLPPGATGEGRGVPMIEEEARSLAPAQPPMSAIMPV